MLVTAVNLDKTALHIFYSDISNGKLHLNTKTKKFQQLFEDFNIEETKCYHQAN